MKFIEVSICFFLTFGAIFDVESATLANTNANGENDAALGMMETKSVKLSQLIETLQGFLNDFNCYLDRAKSPSDSPVKTEKEHKSPDEPAQPKKDPEKHEVKQVEKQSKPVPISTGSGCTGRMYCSSSGMMVG